MPLCRSVACGCSIQSNSLLVTGSGSGPDPWVVEQTVNPSDIAAINANIAALQAYTTPGAWTALTLLGNWVNFGSGYAPLKYRKQGDMVHLRGSVVSTSGSGSGTNICVLPAGAFPPANIETVVKAGTTGTGYLNINTAGAVLFTIDTDGQVGGVVSFVVQFSTTA